jgi:hypothetical protein
VKTAKELQYEILKNPNGKPKIRQPLPAANSNPDFFKILQSWRGPGETI